jgi:hypothetical protein
MDKYINEIKNLVISDYIKKQKLLNLISDNIITNIDDFINRDIIIILGATIYEQHIIEFAEMNNDKYIITIDINILQEKVIVPNNLFLLIDDFNTVELWDKISVLKKVHKIIFDFSVVKFMNNDEWNIFYGKIFNHITNMLIKGGEFHSYISCSISIVETIKIKNIDTNYILKQLCPKYVNNLIDIYDNTIDINLYINNKKEFKKINIKDVDKSNKEEYQKFISTYDNLKKKLEHYFPLEYNVNFYDDLNYILKNPNMKNKQEYFIAIKNN